MQTCLNVRTFSLSAFFMSILMGCGVEPTPIQVSTGSQGNSAPTPSTLAMNQGVAASLDLKDPQDFNDATRGLIARAEDLQVNMADGSAVWNLSDYDFIHGDAPASVNPSLWRQERLNNIHGLFEVTQGVYQLRGFDLSNMSIIEGERGWILVDPLTTRETAAAALAFARQQLGYRPVTAVIITHSHIDHFGGVLAVLEENGETEIIAPQGFMSEATSENVIAGTTMSRRSMFMYGSQLERSAFGHVGSGLGKGPAFGSPGLATPTRIISQTGEKAKIDGINFIFQNAAGSEAPAELTFYLPEKKAFCGAEVVSRNMHNLYTLRGAHVRDARKWSYYINEAIEIFPEMEVYFASHHWPMWGNDDIVDFLKKQRDGYRYIHDQTLRLASQGHTPGEIAETIRLPTALRNSFANRGYYGTLKHNSRAVYQRYFGWYDGNPASLDPLPEVASSKRYVAAMGGSDGVMATAKSAFDSGEYRWVAELLNHLVFAEPNHTEAKMLLAQSYDQLGYQAESGPWRDVYLTGALELRRGPPSQGLGIANAVDLIRQTPISEFMQLIAVMLNGEKADGESYVFNFTFTDLAETYILSLENAVLHQRNGEPAINANATLRITHELFISMLVGQAGIKETLFSDDISIEGSRLDLLQFFAMLDPPDDVFNIVTP